MEDWVKLVDEWNDFCPSSETIEVLYKNGCLSVGMKCHEMTVENAPEDQSFNDLVIDGFFRLTEKVINLHHHNALIENAEYNTLNNRSPYVHYVLLGHRRPLCKRMALSECTTFVKDITCPVCKEKIREMARHNLESHFNTCATLWNNSIMDKLNYQNIMYKNMYAAHEKNYYNSKLDTEELENYNRQNYNRLRRKFWY